MCGRYALYGDDDLAEYFQAKNSVELKRGNYNVAPGQTMPVVMQSEEGRTIEPMRWGLIPLWAKNETIGYKMINARAENLFEKPSWRGPIRRHRCLVPATGFYEWKSLGPKDKQPYFIHPHDSSLFAFAGVWDVNSHIHGTDLWSFSIITTAPNKEMAAIHDRMPVIISPDNFDLWLDPMLDEQLIFESLLQPSPDGSLDMFPVSKEVNVVKNNHDRLVYPLNSK